MIGNKSAREKGNDQTTTEVRGTPLFEKGPTPGIPAGSNGPTPLGLS